MAVAMETLTIQVLVQAANRLRRVAEIVHRPIDQVVTETLQSTLPPLLDDLPTAYQDDLAQLETWTLEQLRQQVYTKLKEDESDRRDELLFQKASGTLTEREEAELETFRKTADLLMYRKPTLLFC